MREIENSGAQKCLKLKMREHKMREHKMREIENSGAQNWGCARLQKFKVTEAPIERAKRNTEIMNKWKSYFQLCLVEKKAKFEWLDWLHHSRYESEPWNDSGKVKYFRNFELQFPKIGYLYGVFLPWILQYNDCSYISAFCSVNFDGKTSTIVHGIHWFDLNYVPEKIIHNLAARWLYFY